MIAKATLPLEGPDARYYFRPTRLGECVEISHATFTELCAKLVESYQVTATPGYFWTSEVIEPLEPAIKAIDNLKGAP